MTMVKEVWTVRHHLDIKTKEAANKSIVVQTSLSISYDQCKQMTDLLTGQERLSKYCWIYLRIGINDTT